MTGDAFEYAIRKDIRNNPIVREVDRERHRDMRRTVMVGVSLVSVLLFWAWQHFELLRHGYQFEQMQREYAAETEVSRQLRLEIDTLRSPVQVEPRATGQLRMVAPTADNTTVIERVVPPPAPPGTALARR